jgi:hypothetical protein
VEDKRDGLDFGEALFWAKKGFVVSRKGWNGKGQWVSYTEGKTLDLSVNEIWTKPIKDVAEQNGGKVTIRPYMNLKTVDNQIQIGWIPSASDMLAKDWYIV